MLAMRSENTEPQDLSSDVGIKSRAQDLAGIEDRMVSISCRVTGARKSHGGPV